MNPTFFSQKQPVKNHPFSKGIWPSNDVAFGAYLVELCEGHLGGWQVGLIPFLGHTLGP